MLVDKGARLLGCLYSGPRFRLLAGRPHRATGLVPIPALAASKHPVNVAPCLLVCYGSGLVIPFLAGPHVITRPRA